MIEVLPLIGPKALRAFNAFSSLLLGLKMLPAYAGETYEEFYEKFGEMDEGKKETFVREALAFVELQEDEIAAVISFAKDKNGVKYGPTNLRNLGVQELFEIIVAVCMEVGRIKIDLVSESEKKKSQSSQLTSVGNT